MKVLIIEDEKLLADSIRSVLERKGFEAECVYDARPELNMRSWEFMTC